MSHLPVQVPFGGLRRQGTDDFSRPKIDEVKGAET
jgi:hypothetical protein